MNAREGPSKLPFAVFTLPLLTVVRRSSMFSPYAARASGLALMRTDCLWPPPMLTRPTPGSCEIFCARRVSAKSSTVVSGSVFEVSASVSTGASAGFTFA